METYDKLKLIDGLVVRRFNKGQFVINQGDSGDEFYLIEQGQCECIKIDSKGQQKQIRVLSEGDHFGEVAILQNVKRTLSVRVLSDNVKVLLLSRDAFRRILGSIKDFIKTDYAELSEEDVASVQSAQEA